MLSGFLTLPGGWCEVTSVQARLFRNGKERGRSGILSVVMGGWIFRSIPSHYTEGIGKGRKTGPARANG